MQPGEKRKSHQHKKIKLDVVADANGNINDVDLLQSIINNKDCDVRERMAASIGHAKCTRPPPPRTISKPVDIAPITNVEEAYLGIGKLASMASNGTIGIDEAGDISKLLEAFIVACRENKLEQDIRAIEEYLEKHPPQQTIETVGGLPDLPLGNDKDGNPVPPILMPGHIVPIKPGDKP
jgi:hypothetical protein